MTRPTSSVPFSGFASGNTSMPPITFGTLATSRQVASPENQDESSVSTFTDIGFARAALSPLQTYAARPSRRFAAPSTMPIIRASKPVPAMTAKCSPFTTPASSVAAPAVERDVERAFDRGRDAEVGREEVRGASRHDPERHSGAGEGVDAPLHTAVTAPHEHEVDTFLDSLLGALACLRALGDLEPHELDVLVLVEPPAKLRESAVEGLLRMGDDRDALHVKSLPSVMLPRSRSHSATRKARCSAAMTHTMPSPAPATTSEMWCAPR